MTPFGRPLCAIRDTCILLGSVMVMLLGLGSSDPLNGDCQYAPTDYTKCEFNRTYRTPGTAPSNTDCEQICEEDYSTESAPRCWWYTFYIRLGFPNCDLHGALTPAVCPESAADAASIHWRRICPSEPSTTPVPTTSSQANTDRNIYSTHTATTLEENTTATVSNTSNDSNNTSSSTEKSVRTSTASNAEETTSSGADNNLSSAGTTDSSYQPVPNMQETSNTQTSNVVLPQGIPLTDSESTTRDNLEISTPNNSITNRVQNGINETTTSTAKTTTNTSCKCRCSLPQGKTSEDAHLPSATINELRLDVNTLSSTRRRKQSSVDSRWSSCQIGGVWVILILVLFGWVVLSDLPYIYRNIRYGKFTITKY